MPTRHRLPVHSFAAALIAVCALAAPASAFAQSTNAREVRPVPDYSAAALTAFFGDARGAYLHQDGPVRAQMGAALGIPDGGDGKATRAWDLGDGRVLHTGCRQHSCMEKGAVVYDTATRAVLAAGMLHTRCAERAPAIAGCAQQPVLTVFLSATRAAPFQALSAIDDWADEKSPGAEREVRTLR